MAQNRPEPSFRDPERKKKLASAFAAIEAIAEEERLRQNIPSVALGVVIDGELSFEKGLGFADLEKKTKPDQDTVYRIASITKSFTAATILSLRDDGSLSLDDPLSKWIEQASKLVYPTSDSPPITLRRLLTHTAGLPREPDSLGEQKKGASAEAVARSLAGLALDRTPGTRFSYSNLGFGLLGIVAGRAGDGSFREVMKKRVLAPLGMSATVWRKEDVSPEHLATAYTKGEDEKITPIEHLNFGEGVEGAGGLYSSVRDMAKYVAFQLAAYPARSAPDSGPLKRSSVREAHFSIVDDDHRVAQATAPAKGDSLVELSAYHYGYGWVRQTTCELDPVIWHNGGIDGYRTDIAFLPEHGVGVIVLTNLGTASPEPIANRALLALHKTGGLAPRSLPLVLSPALEASMKRLLDVYTTWNEAGYKAMLAPGRDVPMASEKAELEGYKRLHGACKSFTPISVSDPRNAVIEMSCERGRLEMELGVGADGLITGFGGRSRDVPIPAALRPIADAFSKLTKKWDDAIYKKHLGRAKPGREEAAKLFEQLRAAHGTCTAKSLSSFVFDRKLVLECERGGNITVEWTGAEKEPDAVTAYKVLTERQGRCPVR